MFNDVTISDRYANDAMRDRVVVAANKFAAHFPGLSKADVLAVYADPNNPLYDHLSGAMETAAIEGFADQTYVIGEIHDLR